MIQLLLAICSLASTVLISGCGNTGFHGVANFAVGDYQEVMVARSDGTYSETVTYPTGHVLK